MIRTLLKFLQTSIYLLLYMSMMWAAIIFRKEERVLLSIISFGIVFHAPLYMKLLLVRGFGELRALEISRRLQFVFSLLYEEWLASDLGPILFNTLYIILALACFFLFVLSGSQPSARKPIEWFMSLFKSIIIITLAVLFCSFWSRFDCFSLAFKSMGEQWHLYIETRVSLSTKGLTRRIAEIPAVIFSKYFQYYFSKINADQQLL